LQEEPAAPLQQQRAPPAHGSRLPGTCSELQGCFTAILWFCLFMSSPADAVIQSKFFPAAATDYCRLLVAETSKFLPLINIRKLLH
jgi:hypothetical protein